MARVLVHYDIKDEAFRTKFQDAITDAHFIHRFEMATESVYCAEFKTTDTSLQETIRALKQAATGAPSGSRIFMEHPSAANNRPEIIQTRIE
jgi:hypothetical protein